MNVQNLSNQLHGNLTGADPVDRNVPAGDTGSGHPNRSACSDRLSLEHFPSRNEHLFARIELEKQNHASFERLKSMRSKLSEYHSAREISAEAAAKTEIGKVLDDPDVREEIARKMAGL